MRVAVAELTGRSTCPICLQPSQAETVHFATKNGAGQISADRYEPAVVSVIALYYLVAHWNDFFTGLIYIQSNSLQPLQIVLRDILLSNQVFSSGAGSGGAAGGYAQQYADQVKYAVIIVSTLPILIVYPFIQKYFEKGVMIGSVKG